MLAQPQRRQHIPSHSYSTSTTASASATPTSALPFHQPSQQLSFDQLSQQLSSQDFFNQQFLLEYLDSQQQQQQQKHSRSDFNVSNPSADHLMSDSSFSFANPAIRVQQSTPQPANFTQASMLPNNAVDWRSFNSQGAPSLQTPTQNQAARTHHRASSSSSVASSGSLYPAGTNKVGYHSFSNHLPTPTHTPTQDSFMNNSNFNTFAPNTSSMDSTMAAHFSMKSALMDQHVADDDVPGFAHSGRHSVSSYGHDSPATPHTTQGEEFEDRYKMPPSDSRQPIVPKFERTFTDIANDNFYDPNAMAQVQQVSQPKSKPNSSLLSPNRANSNDLIQRSLQAAQKARSQSPSSSTSRGVSPFRKGRTHQTSNGFGSPRMGVGAAARAREQEVAADTAYAMKSSVATSEETEPKTISPKDALLDYGGAAEDSKVPLFPDGGANEYDQQYNGGDQYRNATQTNFDTTSAQSYRRDSWATPQFSSNFSTSSADTAQPQFAFVPPVISGNVHGLPFTAASQYRLASNTMPTATEATPEFPAHLTTMESSASEAEPSSQSSEHSHLRKPAKSSADTGTYTCTYHGCSERFETPQKLQKHKREGHRNPNTTTVGPSMTSAALLERTSQAGPHKCERINPTTGKPCDTMFSRPYDLTRHEDTIHNVRKQKVRCALCVEEKTFSRNDALTRHMRVVHPEVDFPGKHRRRGGNHD